MILETQWFGDVVDTPQGAGTNTSPVSEVHAYADSGYIYGFRLVHDDSTDFLFGQENDLPQQPFEPESTIIKVQLHRNSKILRGLDFFPASGGGDFVIGDIGFTQTTAIDDAVLLDVMTSSKTINGVKVICAIKFFYIDTVFANSIGKLLDHFAMIASGLILHSYVLGRSYMEVGKLRKELSIKPPSCDPPVGTDPSKMQLWYRTYRAQENTKEAFLLFAPVAVIASVFGYRAFGQWAPRAVGVLTIIGAYFRYQYLKGYIADTEKRVTPFRYNMIFSVKPIAFLAVASCGYLVGCQLYNRLISHKRKKNTEKV